MRYKRYRGILMIAVIICGVFFTGCGSDKELDEYRDNMSAFMDSVTSTCESLDSIEPTSDTAVEEMLTSLDDLAAQFTILAEMKVPAQFSAIDNLADEAGSYMTQAASLFHQAYDNGVYDENVAAAGAESYRRAMKRLSYISDILQGEMPTDTSITVTTEYNAPGFKEDSQDTENGIPAGTDSDLQENQSNAEPASAAESESTTEPVQTSESSSSGGQKSLGSKH